MTRYKKRNNLQNTFKDYLVPIVGGALLLLIIFSIFNKDSTPENGTETGASENQNENQNPVNITFNGADTTAFISYPNGSNEEITDSENLYKGETIIVKDGALTLDFTNNTQVILNKIAEFKYDQDGNFSLYSSDAWLTLSEDTSITMSYANVVSPAGSVISLTQNEAGSTIYILSGSAKVTNLGGVSTSLIKGQKLSVSRQYAASSDIDLSSEKGNIDSYFKGSDWFIDNKGFEVLEKEDEIEVQDDEIKGEGESGTYLSFNSLKDEMSTNNSTLSVSGKILNDSVASLSINNKQANINTEEKTFTVDSISVGSSINDLVIKIYASDKSILEKNVITVYSSAASNTTTNTVVENTTPVANTGGTTFEVDATDFGFTEPSVTGKFVATGSEITIRGVTTAEGISKVEVNGFTLGSFNGSTWRYHAFERFETLEEGTNQYKVDYYGTDNTIVYTDYYTIVKNPATTGELDSEIISDEEVAQ